jgi:hypothetical protein
MRLDFCVACGRKDGLDHHHAIPRAHDGPDDETNLVTLCHECHGNVHNAEWSLDHAELVKAGQAKAVQRGKKLGLPPAADRMPATVALAKQLYNEGYSFRRISDEMAHRGHLGRKGKPFPVSTIQDMVRDCPQRGRGTPCHLQRLVRPYEYAFYNERGTCEQWIKEGKGAIKWTRLSCRTFAANAVRLQLHALSYNLGNFLRTLATPDTAAATTSTSVRRSVVMHSRATDGRSAS